MLDLLSDESLTQIFKMTTLETVKLCRLLNKRSNLLTKKDELGKDYLQNFWIHPTYFCQGSQSSVTIDMWINRKKRITFINYEDLLTALPQYLQKIGRIDDVRLIRIPINETLLDMLSQQKFLKQIRKFCVSDCTVKTTDENKWFSLLDKLRLKKLRINITKPEAIGTLSVNTLDHVEKVFELNSLVHDRLIEMPWLVDSVLINWFTPEKTLDLPRVVTGLTVEGILGRIKLMPQENKCNYLQEFGIIKNSPTEFVELAIKNAGFSFNYGKSPYLDKTICYQIRNQRGEIVASFGCLVL